MKYIEHDILDNIIETLRYKWINNYRINKLIIEDDDIKTY